MSGSPYLQRPRRSYAEMRAAAQAPHKPTELNPHEIYAPPGDPLHRAEVVIEDLRLKAMVVRVIAYLGLAAALTWALHLLVVSQ